MFVRQQVVSKEGREYRYLKILETRSEQGRSVQRTLVNFGNVQQWPPERLEQALRKVSEFLELDLVSLDTVRFHDCRQLGPFLPAAALWDELGLDDLIRDALRDRRIDLPVAAFAKAMVLNRLVEPRSKKAVWEWLARDVQIPGLDPTGLPLHGYYRTLEYLLRAKRPLEKAFHARVRHLFNQDLSLVFWDLTSTYFEGSHCSRAKHGYSRDHRPDCVQIELGLLVDGEGIPIGHELFEGNVKDVATVLPALERLKRDFGIRRCVFVGDDGMASEPNLKLLEMYRYEYITSLSLRNSGIGAELVAYRPPLSSFGQLASNLWLKPLRQEGKVRYLASYNPDRAAASRRHRRRRLRDCLGYLRSLQAPRKPRARPRTPDELRKFAEAFVQRKGCAHLLRLSTGEPERHQGLEWELDRAALRQEHRMDGLLILQTNAQKLTDEEVARGYRTLWRVEDAFRHLKDGLRLRPIRHWQDARVQGHVFVCVLAYLLERLLERKLEQAGRSASARSALAELRSINVASLTAEGHVVRRRSQITPEQQQLLRVLGVSTVPEVW